MLIFLSLLSHLYLSIASPLALTWEERCTTIAIGPMATTDGSTMCTDTMDCADCDWRMGKVEARDWPEGSMRPIYGESSQYPRYIREDRGTTWSIANLEDDPVLKSEWVDNQTPIIGYIPQVPHTYALLEGLYGYMNEHQVSMGESTCAAKLFAGPVGWQDGKALLNIGELMQIGLERGRTAREAIQIMGDVAMEYGFYGESYDPVQYGAAYVMGEAGEGLTVIDPTEAWIFHILPDDTGTKAVWVAQRVPDDHIAVIANTFVIRDVDPDSPDFMYSDNIFEVAERQGFWNSNDGKPLDFKLTYAPQRYHPEYSNNRQWRVFSLANPSAMLSIETNANADDYPVTMQVDHKISLEEMISYQRDVYQGTELDLTTGLAAGPYGDPNRYQNNGWGNMTIWDTLDGTFPRAISIFRTSTSIVAQARAYVPNELGLVWVSQYEPDVAPYVPMYVATAGVSSHWSSGSMHKYDTEVAWWNFCVVGNYVARYYHFAIESVRELQQKVHGKLSADLVDMETRLLHELKGNSTEGTKLSVVDTLTQFTIGAGDYASNAWKELFPYLLATYRDGYVVTNKEQSASVKLTAMFYPRWWLEAVGYFEHPGNSDPAAILFTPNPYAIHTSTNSVTFTTLLMSVTFSAFIFSAAGFAIAKRKYNRHGYSSIDQNIITEINL
mmetsp:Transcript_9317/g.14032  ORF Transcript_9317/g.14032 Transcript_9317/m.14032 type:complete len:668 (+) Transcript_9317:81-2084(+)